MEFSTEATLAFIERHQDWSFWLALVFAAVIAYLGAKP